MGVAMLQVFGLVLTVCAFACSLVIQGFAVPSVGKGIPGNPSNANAFISPVATPLHLPYGTGLQPPLIIPPLESAPAPQTMKSFSPSVWSSPSASPPNLFVSPPAHNKDSVPSMTPIPSGHCPSTALAPAPNASPSSSSQPNKQPHPRASESMPPNTYKTQASVNNAPLSVIAPGSNVPAPRGTAQSLPPSHSIFLEDPPSLPPDVLTRPALPGNSTSVKPIQSEPPSSPPEQIASCILAPPPRISRKKAAMPIAALANQTACHHAPVSHSPVEAPTASNHLEHKSVPPPCPFSKSTPGSHSPTKHHHAKVYKIASAPLLHAIPPTSASSSSEPPISSPLASSDYHYSPIPTPPPSASEQAKIPIVSPKMSPFGSAPRHPRMPLSPPFRALPPPPPQKDCAPTTCIEPLTYGPPESPCICVLPIQVGLRLTVALYTFFPLVSELAAEISAGVFMKQSQVRIMGANAAGEDQDKAIILIDLLPLGEKFDDTTAYLTFQRFWNKQVVIKASFFGDYHVLYVRYPGLPPSPPLPPSTIGIIASKPYPGHDNNARSMQPLGVDISRHQHKHGPRGSTLAIIILSCFVALLLLCSGLWALIFRHRNCVFQPDPTSSTTIRSLAKSSGIPISMVGSGTSSPSFSLGSSIAAYTGSAKTFSSSDIEKATDFFNETRIIGEGGFGRVYSGVLEDGTKVAMKILKRYDQQGGREFLAEVEMLCRLHHRNLVKLIGICIEDRTRCLVYELIPNGSVESHLHGFDKERSSLDWNARLKIALGAARALAYLHEDSSPRVIHRDFKASNILLEDDFTPKVSDFGLARAALDEGNRHISTRVMGTFGYVAPEYAMTGHLLVKSDVYSYGVVLLELLTGRKPVDMSQPPGQENLVSWARPLLTSKDVLESIVDPSLGPDIPSDSIAKVAAIASMCVEPEVSHRPFMGEVVQALKLVCTESDEMKDMPSRSCSQDDLSITTDARNSTNSVRLAATLLTPSSVSDYDYCVDVERDLSMSELLSSCPKFSPQDSESFRRYSSSGPLRTSKPKPLWKTMRQLSRGSVSEHSMLFKLWPGSH